MSGSKCVFNTATALRRVFIPANLGTSDHLHVTRIFVPALLTPLQQARTYWKDSDWGMSQQTPRGSSLLERARAASASNIKSRGGRPPPPPPPREPASHKRPGPRVKTKLARLPRDTEIMQPYVYVKIEDEDGTGRLSEQRLVKEVLAELDPKTTSLQVVVMPDRKTPDSLRWPICRIVNKREELARVKQEKERKKKSAVKEKELEVNWALAPHDLDHKLRQMQKFLAKGYKVKVLLLRKSGTKAMAKEKDAKTLLEKIQAAVEEVPGSNEWKGREGHLLGSMRIFLQGKTQELGSAGEEGAGEEGAGEESVGEAGEKNE